MKPLRMTKPLKMTMTVCARIFIVSLLLSMTACSEKQPGEEAATQPESAAQTAAGHHPAAVDAQKIAQIEADLRQKVQDNPDSAQAHAQLAGFLLTQNKTAEAIPAYQQAIMHDPENPGLFAALSIAYLHQSGFSMAKAMADEALRLKPDMEQVKKINEYIAAKESVMQQAEKAAPAMQKPDDALHKLLKDE